MPDSGERQPHVVPDVSELYALLSDMLPDLPAIVYRCRNTRSWTMRDLAEPVRDLTGYGPEELVDDAVVGYGDLIHEDDRDRVWEEVQQAVEEGLAFRTSYRIRTRDGEVRWVWEQGRAVSGGEGSEIIGFIQDVTEWREKWKRLEQSVHLLEQTVASLEEAVLVIDTSGEGRGILSANPAAEQIFGYSEDELIGGTTEKLHVSRESFERFGAELEPILERDGVVHAAFPMRRSDGTEFAAEQTVTLLDPEEGLGAGAVSVIRDVSERHTLQQQLQQSQRLEAVGRLAGGIAHDFNNLLTVIRAHSDFALMEMSETNPLVDELRAIQNAADRAAELTNQLLAFSREQVLRPRVVDMNEVVRGTKRLLERVIGEDIRLRAELRPDPLPVRVDPARLEQVIVNLAVNARDAMPEGGTLTLGTGLEASESEPGAGLGGTGGGGQAVQLTVADTGVGMDETTRSRIFEPFFTTKERGKGTGLGLATTYGFVTQSGGTIVVDSEPGRGATFTLRFPIADARPERVAGPTKDAVASLGGITVLVVEDDANVRRVVRKALRRAGCTIRTADSGEAALEILGRERDALDLVVTDLVLPGINGREVADRALALEDPVPVLVMSGYAADSPGHAMDLPPEVGFLQKPFTPAALVERVREALAG